MDLLYLAAKALYWASVVGVGMSVTIIFFVLVDAFASPDSIPTEDFQEGT